MRSLSSFLLVYLLWLSALASFVTGLPTSVDSSASTTPSNVPSDVQTSIPPSTTTTPLPSQSRHHTERPHGTFLDPAPTFSFVNPETPFPPDPPLTDRPPNHNQPHKSSTVAIVFAALAGIIGFLVILTLARCLYTWRRTPRPVRTMTAVDREQLIREMREYAATAPQRARTSVHAPPPPPYERAPSYDSAEHLTLTPD
ncbi:hypothetical protein FA95DRAFT_1600867 [Auriscalpium vulgare]|uniref:Uncharacterized protein n=1 Tax=Auriscalpium vulgare TaxID=40419 RepID=A0ACB8SC03_9AGAM|nr:hypothetical protein FA95DRAFT_1600867 [Auriscalpium vulgare]